MRTLSVMVGWVVCLGSPTLGQVELQAVLLSGDPLPAIGETVSFDGQFLVQDFIGPTINNDGRIAYYCHMNGIDPLQDLGVSPELHDSTSGIITNVNGPWEIVARNQQPVPGLPGKLLREISWASINNSGEILFQSGIGTIQDSQSGGYFVGRPNSWRSLILPGPAVISEMDVVLSSIRTLSFNSRGTAVLCAGFYKPNPTFEGFVAGGIRHMQFLARTRTEGFTGLGGGAILGLSVLNDNDVTAFSMRTVHYEALVVGRIGNLQKVFAIRDQPESAAFFNTITDICINSSDIVVFRASASGPAGPRDGYWIWDGEKTRQLCSEKSLSAEMEATFGDSTKVSLGTNRTLLANDNQLIVMTALTVGSLPSGAIWRGWPGQMRMDWRTGIQAVGAPDGALYYSPISYCANRRGDLVIESRYTGFGGLGYRGYWHVDRYGTISFIAIERLPLEVRPGDVRVVQRLGKIVSSGGGDGKPRMLNDLGQFVFTANFMDGTTAVMVAQLPH